MTRRPDIQSERLTLRGFTPELKRALILRSQKSGLSMEQTVSEILVKELDPELKTIEIIDTIADQLPIG